VENWSANNLDVAVVPSGAVDNSSYLGGATWVVPTDAENSEGAWKLARWLTQPEQEVSIYKATYNLPSNLKAWDDSVIADDQWVKVAKEQLEHTVTDPAVPTWTQVYAVIDSESEKMLSGSQTPEETAEAIQSQAESIGLGW
jgi:multiple sugar transport system substrate-binding protein